MISVADARPLDLPTPDEWDHSLIGIESCIDEAFGHEQTYIQGETSISSAVPPLLFSQLAHGGKTTLLNKLCIHLKGSGYFPVLIDYNGRTSFRHREGEIKPRLLHSPPNLLTIYRMHKS